MINNISNPIYKELRKLKLISEKNLVKISSRTRDAKIGVLKDKKTKIIFLEKCITNKNYYTSLEYRNKDIDFLKKNKSKFPSLKDDLIRKKKYYTLFENKDILDFGCEWAGFLNKIKNAKSLYGIEIRNECIKFIKESFSNINISNDINNYKKKFDVITLFHVLEHIPFHISILKLIKSKLKKNGKIIIEVPHAEDFLLEQDNFIEYRKYIFWSEHLIIHTFNSLKTILEHVGFNNINITFYQRYNFSNHLGWFLNKYPGGHKTYKELISDKFNNIYKECLVEEKKTDTIIAIAENN
jgi:2-polyprenyl-3-methyl-5-hydroxy-6-metoxy-1,4-benzoquinol methylase